jgi:cyanophycinase
MGVLYVIGGAEDKSAAKPVLERFLALAGGGLTAIITAASIDPDESYRRYQSVLEPHVDTVHLDLRHPGDWEQLLLRARAVFMTGGDQAMLANQVHAAGILPLMVSRLEDTLVVAGTSAGAAAMSEHMIAAGEGTTPWNRPEVIQWGRGLGLWPDAVVDQHFSQRGRFPRLVRALMERPGLVGVGIDEDTAVEVNLASQTAAIWGTGTVTRITADGGQRFAVWSGQAGDQWNFR